MKKFLCLALTSSLLASCCGLDYKRAVETLRAKPCHIDQVKLDDSLLPLPPPYVSPLVREAQSDAAAIRILQQPWP